MAGKHIAYAAHGGFHLTSRTSTLVREHHPIPWRRIPFQPRLPLGDCTRGAESSRRLDLAPHRFGLAAAWGSRRLRLRLVPSDLPLRGAFLPIITRTWRQCKNLGDRVSFRAVCHCDCTTPVQRHLQRRRLVGCGQSSGGKHRVGTGIVFARRKVGPQISRPAMSRGGGCGHKHALDKISTGVSTVA